MSKKPIPKVEVDAEPVEHTPTPEEAKEMFKENPGLAAVLTTEGNKTRDQLT